MDGGLIFNVKTQLQWKDTVLNDKVGFAPRSQSLPNNFISQNNALPTRSILSVPPKIRNDKFMGRHASFLPESEPSLLEKWRSWVRGPLYRESYQVEPFRSAWQDSLLATTGALSLLGVIFFISRHSVSVTPHHVKNNKAQGAAHQSSNSSPASRRHSMPTPPGPANSASATNKPASPNKARGAGLSSTGTPASLRPPAPTPPHPTKPVSFQQVKTNLSHLQSLPGHENHSQFVSQVTAEIKSLSFNEQKDLLKEGLLQGDIRKMYVAGHDNVLIKAMFTGLSATKKIDLLSILSEGNRGSGLLHDLLDDTKTVECMLEGLSPNQKNDLVKNQHVLHFAIESCSLPSMDALLTGLTAKQISDTLNTPYDLAVRRRGICADNQTVLDALKQRTQIVFGIGMTEDLDAVIKKQVKDLNSPTLLVYYHRYRLINSAIERARLSPGGCYQVGSYQREARNDTDRLGYSRKDWENSLPSK